MKNVFQIFFHAKGSNPLLVLACLLVAGLTSGIGLMTFLPVVTELAGGGESSSSYLNDYIHDFIRGAGLTPDMPTLLILVVSAIFFKAVLPWPLK